MASEPDDTPEHGLGSREHIRETLERARAAILAAPAPAAPGYPALTRPELRASVTAYVRHLKAEGVPSERMLVQVKAVVREATPPELDVDEARELMEEVVRWSVAAYYDVG